MRRIAVARSSAAALSRTIASCDVAPGGGDADLEAGGESGVGVAVAQMGQGEQRLPAGVRGAAIGIGAAGGGRGCVRRGGSGCGWTTGSWRGRTAWRGSRSGHRVLVDCCPTWSLAPIDHRVRRTHPELQDQLGNGSAIDYRWLPCVRCALGRSNSRLFAGCPLLVLGGLGAVASPLPAKRDPVKLAFKEHVGHLGRSPLLRAVLTTSLRSQPDTIPALESTLRYGERRGQASGRSTGRLSCTEKRFA